MCACIALATLAVASSIAAADEPKAPEVGYGGSENLSIAISWGLYEQPGTELNPIGIVGAPTPFTMQLADSGEHRLFAFVQRRGAGLPYCAETPAQLENVVVALTATDGDPLSSGSAEKTYVWTPSEAGEYVLCAFLDSAAGERPAAINFIELDVHPSPGSLALALAPLAEPDSHAAIEISGAAPVASVLEASVQEPGRPCSDPSGKLAGTRLSASPAPSQGVVPSGPFDVSFTLAGVAPGPYEACAYIAPAPTEQMQALRPYEVGSFTFAFGEAGVGTTLGLHVDSVLSTIPPFLSAIGVRPRSFRVASRRAHAHDRAPVGTAFSFVVSKPAAIAIAIARLVPGAMRHSRCVAPRRGESGGSGRPCTRRVAVGSLKRSSLPAGPGSIPFDGRVGRVALAPARYAATIVAADADGQSASHVVRFAVVR